MFQFTKRWNTKYTFLYFSNIKFTFAEYVSVLHQNTCIFKTGLSNKVVARQNIKKNYLMCQIPIKMLKQHAIPNSSLQNLKIYSSQGCRKTSQKWIMYVANTVNSNLNLFFSGRYHFELWVFTSLRLANTFTTDKMSIKVNDAKTFKNFVGIILRFLLTNHLYCRLTDLTGALKSYVDLVLCIIGSD